MPFVCASSCSNSIGSPLDKRKKKKKREKSRCERDRVIASRLRMSSRALLSFIVLPSELGNPPTTSLYLSFFLIFY